MLYRISKHQSHFIKRLLKRCPVRIAKPTRIMLLLSFQAIALKVLSIALVSSVNQEKINTLVGLSSVLVGWTIAELLSW